MRYFIGFSVRVKIGLLKHSSKFCELLYMRLLTVIVCSCILLRPRKGCEVLRSECVCLSVCLSARISQNNVPKLHEIFCTFYQWSWLTTMEYVMYFRFLRMALCFRIMRQM